MRPGHIYRRWILTKRFTHSLDTVDLNIQKYDLHLDIGADLYHIFISLYLDLNLNTDRNACLTTVSNIDTNILICSNLNNNFIERFFSSIKLIIFIYRKICNKCNFNFKFY